MTSERVGISRTYTSNYDEKGGFIPQSQRQEWTISNLTIGDVRNILFSLSKYRETLKHDLNDKEFKNVEDQMFLADLLASISKTQYSIFVDHTEETRTWLTDQLETDLDF